MVREALSVEGEEFGKGLTELLHELLHCNEIEEIENALEVFLSNFSGDSLNALFLLREEAFLLGLRVADDQHALSKLE
jgi:hypothetical protein